MSSDKYICSCGKPCGTWLGWHSHMATEHKILVQKGDTPATVKVTTPTSTAAIRPAETGEPVTAQQSVVTTPTETVITVKPTVEISGPFVARQVESPKAIDAPGDSVGTAATTREEVATVVEPQKKTATATAEATTASGKPLQVQLPPMHFHIPVPGAEGRRDQPRMVVVDESKGEEREPVISTEGLKGGLPAEVTTHQVELSTAAPKIALSHKTFLLYDYARGVGFKGSLADFIEQTIEDYFAERKIRVTVSREA